MAGALPAQPAATAKTKSPCPDGRDLRARRHAQSIFGCCSCCHRRRRRHRPSVEVKASRLAAQAHKLRHKRAIKRGEKADQPERARKSRRLAAAAAASGALSRPLGGSSEPAAHPRAGRAGKPVPLQPTRISHWNRRPALGPANLGVGQAKISDIRARAPTKRTGGGRGRSVAAEADAAC